MIERNSYWRLKDQPQYRFKVIGTAIEGGGGVRGAIVMYEQQNVKPPSLSYSWTTESHFMDSFAPDQSRTIELSPEELTEMASWFDMYLEAVSEHYQETIEEHPENESIAHETLMELRERAITVWKRISEP